MHSVRLFLALVLASSFFDSGLAAVAAGAEAIPRPDHIVLVIEENKSYSEIIGNPDAPYINSLAAQGALFTNSYGVEHPSQPNYLDLFSGSNQGVTYNETPPYLFTTQNVGAGLIAKGFSFTGYAESLPFVGYMGDGNSLYQRKHNPWVNWQDVATNAIPAESNRPFTDFPIDFTKLPTLSIVVANEQNNMHTGSISAGDTWLRNNLDSYVQWAKTHNSLLIVTFDEDDLSIENANHISTFFFGPMVFAGQYNELINHYNVLRTIEEMFGLDLAGNSASATPIIDVFFPRSTILLEAESLTVTSKSADTYRIFSDSNFGAGIGAMLDANAAGDFLTYKVPIASAGSYAVKVGVKTNPARGIFQLSIDGLKQGDPQDEYSPGANFTELDLGTATFDTTGDKAFTFSLTGKNASSSSYTLCLDYIRLEPLSIVYEVENLPVAATSSGESERLVTDPNSSSGTWAFFASDDAGDFITYTVNVPKARKYNVKVRAKKYPFRGIFQFSSNGANHGSPQDLYAPSAEWVELDLGDITFATAGEKAFRFLIIDKNPSSGGFSLGLNYIKLTPR
ncbi:MAG: hypothetical protein M3O82_01910 [Verrucomicrobiota bacterium]|nr:hypothetical protein [Verrucomicrobiota bacterium]